VFIDIVAWTRERIALALADEWIAPDFDEFPGRVFRFAPESFS
jgi:hypothetical protein